MSNVILDTREFDKAMVQYAAASGKDFADISNRQTFNLAIQGLKLSKRAERTSIRKVEHLDWWPKYVAKSLSKLQGKFTRAEARKYSKKLIRARLKSVGFMKFFFVKMSQAVAPYSGRPPRKGKSFAGFDAQIIPANKKKPVTQLIVGYTYRRRSDKTARSTEKMLQRVLSRAVRATVADIRTYVDRKMGKTARRFSAK